MALITCPECQREISDRAAACPHCGYPMDDASPAPDSIPEPQSAPIPDIPEEETPAKIHELTDEEMAEMLPGMASVSVKKPKEKKVRGSNPKKMKLSKPVIGVIAAICVVLVAVFGIMGKQAADKRAAAEARAAYIDNLESFASTALDGGADAERICNLTLNVWRNTIYDEYDSETSKYTHPNGFCNDDFNDSLALLYSDPEIIAVISTIERNQESVKALYRALQNPADEFKSCYDVVDDLYSAYYNFTTMAVSPSGSYNSFSDAFSEYDTLFVELYNKLLILIPEE